MKKNILYLTLFIFFFGCKKENVGDTIPIEPDKEVVVTGKNILLLVFDGITLSNKTDWNFPDSLRNFSVSGLTAAEQKTVVDKVQDELEKKVGADILVTTKMSDYTNSQRKGLIIVTKSSKWYSDMFAGINTTGGVAVVNSFYSQNGTPAFVFSPLLSYVSGTTTKYIIPAISATVLHEFGHMMGLYHVNSTSDWMCGTNLQTSGKFSEPIIDINGKNVYEKSTIIYGVEYNKLPPGSPYGKGFQIEIME